MYRYIIRKSPGIILYFILAPLRALSAAACAGALAVAVDYANGGDLSRVWKYVLVFSVYILLDLIIDALDQAVRLRLTKRAMVALKSDVYHKLSHMCYVHFFQRNTADYMSNMTMDVEILRDSYFYILLKMYADFLRFAVAIAVLLWISPVLGFFVLVTSLLQTLVPILYAKKLERAGEQHSNAQENHMRVLKENLSAFMTAKTFHMEDKLERNYVDVLESAEECRRKMQFTKEWTSSLSYVFNQVAHLGVFLLGAIISIKGKITIAEVVAASELIVYISYPILWLNGELTELRTAKAPSRKLQAIINEPEDLGGEDSLDRPSGQISVCDLRFSYGGREILSGITYEFQSGKKYLIVGASGSGKSTFFNIIAGLRYDYTGKIILGNVELRDLSRQSLTNSLCVINQEPFLFDDTLYNNVCLYEEIDEASVIEALNRVELHNFLSELPKGINTPLGENAAAMSGGEKQRVVIARALVRKTPVLLLDESTSHLDPNTAAGIERLVLNLNGVTVLLVSHNATETARNLSDEVLEMKDGVLQLIS